MCIVQDFSPGNAYTSLVYIKTAIYDLYVIIAVRDGNVYTCMPKLSLSFIIRCRNDVIPIVMGAHPDDYKRSAPKHSYIHVDDYESPQKLAEYLHELDKDDEKYNEYFKWKVRNQISRRIGRC